VKRKALAILVTLALFVPTAVGQEFDEALIRDGLSSASLALPSGVSVDSDGNFFIINDGTQEILSLDKEYNLRFRFGGVGDDPSALVAPAYILPYYDKLLISDTGCIKIFDNKGVYVKSITSIGDTKLSRPIGLSSDSRGRIYICDFDLDLVIISEKDFSLFKTLEVKKPSHCYVTSSGRYIVLSHETKKAYIYSAYMSRIKEFGDFEEPKSLTTDGGRLIYVLDGKTIEVFNINGESRYKWRISPKEPLGLCPSIALYNEKLFATSKFSNELISIDDSGRVKTEIEYKANKLFLPDGFEIDENGRIHVANTQNNIIEVCDQAGDTLFTFDCEYPGKLSISKSLIAVILQNKSQIAYFGRDGSKLFEVDATNPIDCDFSGEEYLYVLTGDGKINKFQGSDDQGTVVTKDYLKNSISLDCNGDFMAVANPVDSEIVIMTIHGENETVITTPSPPRDLVLLSRERVIAFCDDGLYLLNQHSEIMSSFGKAGGPRTLGEPNSKEIDYSAKLDSFTTPVAVSKFGSWLYTLDRVGMRLVRFNKELLLAPPEVNISPKTIDFGDIPQDGEGERELVITNIGGETLEGVFSQVPKWITINKRRIKGDDVVVKIMANTLHFVPDSTYIETLVLDTNAGRFEIPCKVKVPNTIPSQIDITIQIGNKIATIGGEKINLGVPPYIHDGKTMVPLRFIAEAFGGQLDYDSGYIDINFPKREIWVSMEINDENVIVDSGDSSDFMKISPPPTLKSGTTFVPLTFFTSILDCETYWDNATKTIRLVYIQQD